MIREKRIMVNPLNALASNHYLAANSIHMIPVSDAIRLIQANTPLLPPCSMPLRYACGYVLSEDIYANVSIPGFKQAAMDGYAFRFSDLAKSDEFIVHGEVAAGDQSDIVLQHLQAVRIFTGAA